MWFLPTFGRPGRCQDALDSVAAASTSTPGIVIVDGDPDPGYRSLRLPKGWTALFLDPNVGVCRALQQAFARYPHLQWYGFITDDSIVRSPGWDLKLVEAAGSNRIANSGDGWQAHERLHGAVVFGGDLLRALGWWAPPGLIHCYVDDVWEAVAGALRCWCHVPEVVVEHRHVGNDKAPMDATYEKGEASYHADQATFRELMTREIPDAIIRAIPVAVPGDPERQRKARARSRRVIRRAILTL
jgi:hypothetical protein